MQNKSQTKQRGRQKKAVADIEIAETTNESSKKLTLAEKQEAKLVEQRRKAAAKGNAEPKNKDHFYCTNKELHQELLKWRDSNKYGVRILKKVGNKFVETEINNTLEHHEAYQPGTQYFVKLSTIDDSKEVVAIDEETHEQITQTIMGPNAKLLDRAKKDLNGTRKSTRSSKNCSKVDTFAEEHDTWVLHDVTDIVKRDGWAFNYDVVEDRILTDRLGNMMLAIGDKLLNHSSFRNYNQELKLDMRSQFFCKLIKGLKNYNFKFNNPFAFFTTCAWNSFLIVLNQHYKHQNIRKDLMQKMAIELQAYTGISPNTGLARCINAYLENDASGQ